MATDAEPSGTPGQPQNLPLARYFGPYFKLKKLRAHQLARPFLLLPTLALLIVAVRRQYQNLLRHVVTDWHVVLRSADRHHPQEGSRFDHRDPAPGNQR